MSELANLRIFVAVAEADGFAAAARRLQISAPAVTRAIAALEQHLGARLLRRSTRSVTLTDVGTRFLADCRRVLAALDEAESSARGAHLEPQGELAITAPVMFGRLYIAPLLLDFLTRHHKVTARTYFVDRIVHLLDEGYDVAVRIAALRDSSHVAVRVGSVRRIVVAAPSYLAAHGVPRSPADLGRHHAIGISGSSVNAVWRFGGHAARQTPQPEMRFAVNANDVAIAAAVAGHGLARVLSYQVAAEIADGRLRRVLEKYEPPAIPVQLVSLEGRNAAAKVRAFVEFAAARLRADPTLRG